jgi:hypothetical protein
MMPRSQFDNGMNNAMDIASAARDQTGCKGKGIQGAFPEEIESGALFPPALIGNISSMCLPIP